MNCPRCEADPHPKGFGDPRNCAFKRDRLAENSLMVVESDFTFDPDNWNCATITALIDAYDPDGRATIYGNDESLDLILCDPEETRGWLVLTRYKRRGRVSSAVRVGDFSPPKPLTLALANTTMAYWAARLAREARDAGW